jgi:signal transduction histidine kinase
VNLRFRSIQSQLIASFLLFEIIALALFSGLLLRERAGESDQRAERRLEYQSATIAALSEHAIGYGPAHLQMIVQSMLELPTIGGLTISAPGGVVLASSDKNKVGTLERTPWDGFLPQLTTSRILRDHRGIHGVVAPVYNGAGTRGARLVGYVWVFPSPLALRREYGALLPVTIGGALLVLVACTIVATLLARSISLPLRRLLLATRRIVRDPEDTGGFPLAVQDSNEATDLTIACNRMVAAIEEQRTGINNTLALLDSMLAHAPIGVAFFDRQGCIVRANHFLAEMQRTALSFHLGRSVEEAFARDAGMQLRGALDQVFSSGEAVRDLEVKRPFDAVGDQITAAPVTWLVNIYPVRSATDGVRWAGALIVDITSRLHAEEALRKTEKLAAAGRLAASIAHEINNPLEAVTNLLFLLETQPSLDETARGWVQSAQHEIERVSAITQQTLRFYRQSTRPVRASLPELLDSVLTLYRGRINTLQVECLRLYRGEGNLLCLAGELRQLFANLIGNGLDAMQPGGGRLYVRATATDDVCNEAVRGIRVTVADTGCGMSAEVRQRIFEPFFTTKEATGTGLGLWVGAEIMEKHGVRLRIRSRETSGETGGGTVFMLFFPEDAVTMAPAKP